MGIHQTNKSSNLHLESNYKMCQKWNFDSKFCKTESNCNYVGISINYVQYSTNVGSNLSHKITLSGSKFSFFSKLNHLYYFKLGMLGTSAQILEALGILEGDLSHKFSASNK